MEHIMVNEDTADDTLFHHEDDDTDQQIVCGINGTQHGTVNFLCTW